MDVVENGYRIRLLGDPHLGRAFVNGVPLHRRGERERLVWQAFLEGIHPSPLHGVPDIHICLGDLFDKWVVSFDLILNVADAYRSVASHYPHTIFYVLKGNHDWVRDLERRSAFDVFSRLISGMPNIKIVDEAFWIPEAKIALCPWHPLQDVAETTAKFSQASVLFGHFDIEFGEHNMVPTQLHYQRIYTGHDHKVRSLKRDGTEVIVVGSMQPYAHGEEPNDRLYVTVRAEDITDPSLYRDKCLRIIGRYDEPIDCLQITFKQDPNRESDDDIGEVTLGDFNMENLFAEVFGEVGVSAERTGYVLEQYHSKRAANGV